MVAEADKDCTCVTCDKDFHHLGIARHRAMHRDKKECCEIVYSDGRKSYFNFGPRPKEQSAV